MDIINLPLILFLAVCFTGLVWLADIVFFAKQRKARALTIETQFEGLSESQKNADKGYVSSYANAMQEPAVVEYSKSFFPLLLLVFVLRSFIVEPFQIPSESMVPTLEVGDFILVNKFSYGVRLPLIRKKIVEVSEPKRGDVMVFFPPNEKRYFIKRVVGLPGDTIRYANNVLYVNGKEIKQEPAYMDTRADARCPQYEVVNEFLADSGESHFMRKCVVSGYVGSDRTWKVREGHYFMMGDNRDNSSDSRVWGQVPEDRIVGKAFAIWMHWESIMSIPSFSRVGSL